MAEDTLTPTTERRDEARGAYADRIPARGLYECDSGGWKDGRFGQAYDLVVEALKERGECMFEWRRHPLLKAIEAEDDNYE